MEKEVLITIKSSQSTGGEEAEPTELITLGSYACRGGLKKFSYMESAYFFLPYRAFTPSPRAWQNASISASVLAASRLTLTVE